MTAKEVGRIIWRLKAVAAVAFVVVIGAGSLFLSRQATVYQSQSSIALLPIGNDPTTLSFYPNVVTNLLPTYVQLVSSPQFLTRVAGRLPFPESEGRLRRAISAQPVMNADVIDITARAGQPSSARLMASAATEEFTAELGRNGLVRFSEFSAPRTPSSPVSPRPSLVMGVSVLLGLVLAVTAAIAWDRLFGRVRKGADLTAIGDAPVIGVLPFDRRLKRGSRIVVNDPGEHAFDEAIRGLRTNLIFSMGGSDVSMAAVTSVSHLDGKSTLVANLAAVTAELGFRVVVVDADIYHPAQHRIFGVGNDRGFTSLIHDNAAPASLLCDTGVPGVQLVPAGPPLQSRAQEVSLYVERLRELRGLGDIIIVDTPPLRASADIPLLAAAARSTVLAVRAGGTSLRQVRAAVESIDASQSQLLGIVLTQSSEPDDLGGPVGYYLGYRRQTSLVARGPVGGNGSVNGSMNGNGHTGPTAITGAGG